MAENKVHRILGNIQKAIDYILDPEKTENGLNVGCRHVIPECAGELWGWEARQISKKSSQLNGKKASVEGYHFIQSFKGRECNEHMALELTREWIESFVPEGCGYVIACHNDKPNIHVHVIVSPTDMLQEKIWHPFFKGDLPRWKHLANEINRKAGLSVIRSENKNSRTYYEWQLEQKGMSQKTYIKKCIDAAIPKVNSYKQLCDYLRCFGFEIDDGLDEQQQEEGQYHFTLNQKMFIQSKETEDQYYFRIPYTTQYMYINKKDCKRTSDGKTTFAFINLEETYQTFTKNGKTFERTGQDLCSYFEKKSNGRKGLRIKTPQGEKFFRERNLGAGYTIDDITERIEKFGQMFSDPEIEKFIRSHASEEDRSDFFYDAGVPRYEKSEWARMSRKEKYYKYRTDRIQRKLNEHYFNTHNYQDINNIDKLKEERQKLHEEIDKVNKDLAQVEKELDNIYKMMFEMEMQVSQKDINDFVTNNLSPLRNDKKYLKEKISALTKRIKEAERKQRLYAHEETKEKEKER